MQPRSHPSTHLSIRTTTQAHDARMGRSCDGEKTFNYRAISGLRHTKRETIAETAASLIEGARGAITKAPRLSFEEIEVVALDFFGTCNLKSEEK